MRSRLCALLALTGLVGCSPLAEMQTGRVLDRGQAEVTSFVTSMGLVNRAGVTDDVQSSYGVLAGIGVLDQRWLDFRFRYEHIRREFFEPVHVFGFGPKVRLGSDDAAFYLPVGFGVSDDLDTSDLWEIQPTVLMTENVGSWVEFTSSAKAVIRLATTIEPGFALNLGLGIGPNPRRFAVRPELGMQFGPAGSPTYHASLGVTVGIGEFPDIVPPEQLVGGFAIQGLEFDASFREIHVTGAIVNRTGTDLERARFRLVCMDPLGTVLTETYFDVERLKLDEPRPFDVVLSGFELDRVTRCILQPAPRASSER